MTHPTEPELAASAVQPDPAAHSAWIGRIRQLRLDGCTLDEARAIAGPMPASLDELASHITYGILLAAFAELGVTSRAFSLAAEAVLATDAIEGSPDARTVQD